MTLGAEEGWTCDTGVKRAGHVTLELIGEEGWTCDTGVKRAGHVTLE